MIYNDLVYEKVNITEPVILELFNLPWLQRLKGVEQGGYVPLLAKPNVKLIKTEHNRFAHSVGVYLLLKRFNAPIEEQIAGLLHDVSHSAFSHCVDYWLKHGNGKEQNYESSVFKKFIIKKTDIPKILKKHGFNINYILDDKNFPLKENKSPDLCADRIDFSLRDSIIFEEISRKGVREILNDLITENNNWVFQNSKIADRYAKLYLKINKIYYAGIASATMFATVGDFIGYALKKKYITEKDLYYTDQIVLEKINKNLNRDKKLNLLWRRMNNKNSVRENLVDYDKEIFCKSRIIDPLIKNEDKYIRLSEVKPDWKEVVRQELVPKQYFLKYNF